MNNSVSALVVWLCYPIVITVELLQIKLVLGTVWSKHVKDRQLTQYNHGVDMDITPHAETPSPLLARDKAHVLLAQPNPIMMPCYDEDVLEEGEDNTTSEGLLD